MSQGRATLNQRARRIFASGTGIAVLIGLAACQRIEERYCDLRLPVGHAQVRLEEPDPKFEQRYSAFELDRLEQHLASETTMGLTRAKSRSTTQIQLHTLPVADGVCVRPDIVVQIGFASMQVDLATDLPAHSCLYNQVLGHEMRHVDVYRSHLTASQSTLQAALDERVTASHVYHFASMDAAQEYFRALQDEWLTPLTQQTLDAVAVKQAEVDTPEEYRRVEDACRGQDDPGKKAGSSEAASGRAATS